jgi:formylglycine-generating enzyme required for sulfatase activity
MPRLHHLLSSFLILCAIATAAPASTDRAALVIGNASYEVGRLNNPINDANDVSAALRRLGFEVTLGTDLGREDMLRQLDAFRSKIRPGGLALVFYAGHAVEVDGQNWLLPVRNASIRTQADVPIYSVSAQDILRKVEEGGARLNLLVLDACRDNPLPSGARSASRGLGAIATGNSTLVAYSTAPGKTAADGSGRNSPYTAALLQALSQEHISVPDLFNQVGADVMRRTGGAQVPWNSNTPIWPPIQLAGVGMSVTPPTPIPGASTGTLVLDLTPSDAQVYLDGALLPQGVREVPGLMPGRQTLLGRRNGYQDHELSVFIVAGQRTQATLGLSALAATQAPATAQLSTTQIQSADTASPLSAFRDRLSSGGEGPGMVHIPAGSFTMGSPSHEEGRTNDEGPQRTVNVPAFAMGKYAVTFAEYDRFAEATGRGKPADEGWGRGRRPVINVSWEDARAYAAWLSEQTGQRYRLPSEAEWEYAARAGTTGPFSFSGVISPQKANCHCNQTYGGSNADSEGYRRRPVDVGSLPANPWGLHEVHGNVWEWVEDVWHDNYSGAPTDGSAWTAGGYSHLRALRGGSWYSIPDWVRSAMRLTIELSDPRKDVGFRLARTL